MIDNKEIDALAYRLEPGQTHRMNIGPLLYKIHIVSIIDEGKGIYVVYRYFGKRKQWWHYEIADPQMLALLILRAVNFETTKS